MPWAPWLSGLRRDHRPPVRERTQRGRANPTRATVEGRQSWGGQWIQPGHSRRAEAPFSPAPTEADPEVWIRPARGGTSPTFPWMQDTPERLRSRLRWTPRLSKPTLILAGALHAYNPAFSEYIWAVDIRRKGGDLGHDMLGDKPYSTMCSMAMAGKVAFVGGGPNCRM